MESNLIESLNPLETLIIDDNDSYLKDLKILEYRTITTNGKSYQDITNEIYSYEKIEHVFINISLLFNTTKRLDYMGIDLMSRLMFEIRAGKWNLLSFEKKDSILKKHNTQILSKLKNVNIVDYITFLKVVAKNARQ